jgi:hypothetical protein
MTLAIAILIVLILVALVNPFMLWMPTMLQMTALVVIAALVVAYAGFILAERGGDEREVAHRAAAGRAGFIIGIVVLTAALLAQGFERAIDPWIATALSAMLVAKASARYFAGRNG